VLFFRALCALILKLGDRFNLSSEPLQSYHTLGSFAIHSSLLLLGAAEKINTNFDLLVCASVEMRLTQPRVVPVLRVYQLGSPSIYPQPP